MQSPIITPDDVKRDARDISEHISDKKIYKFINESENIDIKSAFGDSLFIDIKENPGKYEILLNGGIYTDECGNNMTFSGLKEALIYYTYARLIRMGNYNVTRLGLMQKQNEYSTAIEYKERITASNEAFSVANRYLKECLRYLQSNKKEYPLYKGKGAIRANRTIYRIIGE